MKTRACVRVQGGGGLLKGGQGCEGSFRFSHSMGWRRAARVIRCVTVTRRDLGFPTVRPRHDTIVVSAIRQRRVKSARKNIG